MKKEYIKPRALAEKMDAECPILAGSGADRGQGIDDYAKKNHGFWLDDDDLDNE